MNCGICNLKVDKELYKCPKCSIKYCSVNCYRDITHADCESKFKVQEFHKIIPQIEDSVQQSSELLKHETSQYLNFLENEEIYTKLSPKEKHQFQEFLGGLMVGKDKVHLSQVLPWYVVYSCYNNLIKKELIEDLSINKEPDEECFLPKLSKNVSKDLKLISRTSCNAYNKTLGIMIHRLVITYAALNRLSDNSSKVKELSRTKMLLELNKFIESSESSCLKETFSSYEKMLLDVEVDVISCTYKQRNLKDQFDDLYPIKEEFFIDVYRDVMILLCETDLRKLPLCFYALSEIYYLFKKVNMKAEILKKISFFIIWVKFYYQNEHFSGILNYLQFRSEYHRLIVQEIALK